MDKRVLEESTLGKRDNLFIQLFYKVNYILVKGLSPSIVIPSLRTARAELNSNSRCLAVSPSIPFTCSLFRALFMWLLKNKMFKNWLLILNECYYHK